jgi:hypothetical protein
MTTGRYPHELLPGRGASGVLLFDCALICSGAGFPPGSIRFYSRPAVALVPRATHRLQAVMPPASKWHLRRWNLFIGERWYEKWYHTDSEACRKVDQAECQYAARWRDAALPVRTRACAQITMVSAVIPVDGCGPGFRVHAPQRKRKGPRENAFNGSMTARGTRENAFRGSLAQLAAR